MKKCLECGGVYSEKMIDFSLYGISLGRYKAKVCNSCNDTLFNESESNKIDETAKEKKIWGLESKTTVGKVGNSLDIKISKKLAEFAGLKKGENVSIYPESRKKLIVEIG